MLGYTIIGAIVGAIIGHVIPPGYFFWFVIGSLCGYLTQKYVGRRY